MLPPKYPTDHVHIYNSVTSLVYVSWYLFRSGSKAHFNDDVLPFLACCKATNNCAQYFLYRPTSDCEDYNPPRNGKGCFSTIQMWYLWQLWYFAHAYDV